MRKHEWLSLAGVIGTFVLMVIAATIFEHNVAKHDAAAASDSTVTAAPPVSEDAPKKTVWDREPGVVAVYEGGRFGRSDVESTPVFQVENDWSIDVQLKGDFWRATLAPEKKPAPPKKRDAVAEWMEAAHPTVLKDIYHHGWPKTFSRDFTDGGRFQLFFEGNGVWKVTIRQGSGKID